MSSVIVAEVVVRVVALVEGGRGRRRRGAAAAAKIIKPKKEDFKSRKINRRGQRESSGLRRQVWGVRLLLAADGPELVGELLGAVDGRADSGDPVGASVGVEL